MEEDLNSYFPGDTTYCSVVVLWNYVSLLGFPLDTAALQSTVVEVRSKIRVDFSQFRSVKRKLLFPSMLFSAKHQSIPEGSASLQHPLSLVPRTREFLCFPRNEQRTSAESFLRTVLLP